MAKKEDKKEEKKTTAKKEKAEKKVEEKLPVLDLISQSSFKQSMILGALSYKGLLEEFKEDLIKETENLKLSKSEFEKIINDYQNRRL